MNSFVIRSWLARGLLFAFSVVIAASFVTPLLSTSLLMWYRGQALQPGLALAVAMIVGAAYLGSMVTRR